MNEFIRKGFLLGIGTMAVGKEKLEKKLNELVEKNELTKDEAKSLMKSYMEKGEAKKEEWSEKSAQKAKQSAKEAGIATENDIAQLNEKIIALEARIAALESKQE